MDIIILREVSANQTIVQCGYCNGTGRQPAFMKYSLADKEYLQNYFDSQILCPICNGKGKVLLEHDSVLVECGCCDMTGHRVYGNHYETRKECRSCDGVGVVSIAGKTKIIR